MGYIGTLGNVCVCVSVCVHVLVCMGACVRVRLNVFVLNYQTSKNVPTQSQVLLINHLICLTLQLHSPYHDWTVSTEGKYSLFSEAEKLSNQETLHHIHFIKYITIC